MICPKLLEFVLLGTWIDHISLLASHFRWIYKGVQTTNAELCSPFHFLAFENRAKCTRAMTARLCGYFPANNISFQCPGTSSPRAKVCKIYKFSCSIAVMKRANSIYRKNLFSVWKLFKATKHLLKWIYEIYLYCGYTF